MSDEFPFSDFCNFQKEMNDEATPRDCAEWAWEKANLAKCQEVEELKSEIEEVISSRPADVCNGWRKERDALQSKVTDLEAKAKRYEAALKYIEGITFDTLSSPRDLIIGMCHTKAVRALKEQAGEDQSDE